MVACARPARLFLSKRVPMNRPWGPAGYSSHIPVSLESGIREQIRAHLAYRGVEPSTEFFNGLDDAVSRCVAMRRIAEQSRPGQVRQNLQRAADLALGLNDALNDLDGNARHLIREADDVCVGELERHLFPIITALIRAQGLAEKYPSGRLPELSNVWLALDIKYVMEKTLGLPATSTKDGDWESLLVIVLESDHIKDGKARGRTGAHSLIRRALKAERPVGSDGVAE